MAPTAFALTEQNHAGSGDHASASFYAMMAGGVLGGALFVVLDAVVNKKGGYLRKTSTTLAYLAKQRRENIREVMGAILEVPPFDALPGDIGQTLASMLRPADFRQGESIYAPDDELSGAHIILEGVVDVEIGGKHAGKHAGTFGPGNFIGVLALFIPGLTGVATIRAKSDVKFSRSNAKTAISSGHCLPPSTMLAAPSPVSVWSSSNST